MSQPTVNITCYKGNYDFLHPQEEHWDLRLVTPYGTVSMLFDEEPNDYHFSVEDCINRFVARMDDFWIYSKREATNATLAEIRKHLPECEILYGRSEINRLRKKVEQYASQIESWQSTIAYLEAEMADAATDAGDADTPAEVS